MGITYSNISYKDAAPSVKSKVRACIAAEIKPYLDQDVATFRLTQKSSVSFLEDKTTVTFPVKLYEEVCREIIHAPFCFKQRTFTCEILIVRNAGKGEGAGIELFLPLE